MKVSNKIGNPMSTSDAAKLTKSSTDAVNEKSRKSARSSGVESSAKVDVSQRAQDIRKAKEIAMSSSVDEAKVERLQKLIDAGKYSVDAGTVADRLVDEHLRTST